MIATKVIPLLVTFLVNKSGTKAEFERYHECVIKLITRIKDKRLQDLQNNPFKAKAEEPADAPLQIPTLDALLNNTKAESLDNLFSKQNQIGGANQGQSPKTLDFGLPNPGADNGGFDFGDFNSFPATPVATVPTNSGLGLGLGSSGSNVGTPTPGLSGMGGFSLPKPPEKPMFKPPTLAANNSNSGSGGISMMDLGFGSTNNTSMTQTFGSASNTAGNQKSNYSAFDEFTLNDDAGSQNMLGLGGLGNSGGNTGGFAGLGNSNASAGGFGAGNSGMGTLGGMGMGNTDMGMNLGLGSFGGGAKLPSANSSSGYGSLNNLGGGLGQNSGNDPFSKSNMGGLMLGSNNDPFDFSSLSNAKPNSNMMGSNPGMGNNMGFGSNSLGMDNSMMGGSNFNLNMNNGGSSMGGMNLLGNGNMTGGFAGPMPSNQGSSSFNSKPGGLFSNPNLVIKGASNSNQNSKPATSGSNLNDFNLL